MKVGEIVEWSSQAQGSTKKKVGEVVEVVQAGNRPDRVRFPDLYKGVGCGFGRSHESYVVRVGTKHYWPVASKLKAASVCPHCTGTGVAAVGQHKERRDGPCI